MMYSKKSTISSRIFPISLQSTTTTMKMTGEAQISQIPGESQSRTYNPPLLPPCRFRTKKRKTSMCTTRFTMTNTGIKSERWSFRTWTRWLTNMGTRPSNSGIIEMTKTLISMMEIAWITSLVKKMTLLNCRMIAKEGTQTQYSSVG